MAEVELPKHEELEELRGKTFTKRVALTTALYAVVLAIASLGGTNAMKHMLMAPQQASDHWTLYQTKDPYFDYAEVLLQIAIVMASIAILASSRPLFFFSLGLAGLGAFLTLDGFMLFLKIPFLHGGH